MTLLRHNMQSFVSRGFGMGEDFLGGSCFWKGGVSLVAVELG